MFFSFRTSTDWKIPAPKKSPESKTSRMDYVLDFRTLVTCRISLARGIPLNQRDSELINTATIEQEKCLTLIGMSYASKENAHL